MKKLKKFVSCFMAACMLFGNVPDSCFGGRTVPAEVYAAAITSPLNFVGQNGRLSGDGYTWEGSTKTLTLRNGFSLNVNGQGTSAMTLKPGTTIVLEGEASITTDDTGIDAMGDLTIQSAVDEEGNQANGQLTIKCTQTGSGSTYKYGIKIEHGSTLSVTQNAILTMDGGQTCLQSTSAEDETILSITDRGMVNLSNSLGIGGNNFKLQSPERIIYDVLNKNNAFDYLSENAKMDISGQKSIKLMACGIDGTSDGKTSKDTTYTLTYDGEDHEVKVNTRERSNITIEPSQTTYSETANSEYLEDGSDYRDKRTIPTTTSYNQFTEDRKFPHEAAAYTISYKGTGKFSTLQIDQRKVVVTGLKAVRKSYDGWADAQIDYSDIQIKAVNDVATEAGITANDLASLGDAIVPYAKAYFLTKTEDAGSSDCKIGGIYYIKSKDVAYVNDKIENGIVDTKKVFIEEITLSDPNYQVVPYTDADHPSQMSCEGEIYPRSLKESEYIACSVDPTERRWTRETWKDVDKEVTDTSSATPEHPLAAPVVLTEGTDYTVSAKTYNEIGNQTVVFTGRGNYMDSINSTWQLLKAVREVTIQKTEKKIYNKTAYPIATSGAFFYQIMDTSNNEDVTDDLEEGSNLKITYKGRNKTVYEESEKAPVNAGDYTVTVSVEETRHYLAAEKSLDFTIEPKVVEVEWTCTGASISAEEINPKKMTYNGTKNIFRAVVLNPEEGDVVNVTKVTYSGKTTGNVTLSNAETAPREAGSFTAKAAELDNTNYTTVGTPVHSYTVDRAVVSVTWTATGSTIYNAADQTPIPEVTGLFSNEEGVKDVCKVNKWIYTGKDVFGNAYTETTRAVNVTDGTGTVKASGVDNPNYILTTEEDLTAEFKITPLDLGTLEVGTLTEKKELWAHEMEYTGYQVKPTLEWKRKSDDCGEVLEDERDYKTQSYSDASEYREDGMLIVIEGMKNYKGTNTIPWNIDKIPASVKVTNYQPEGEEPFTVTYGTALPEFEYDFVNLDIERDNVHPIEYYMRYEYTGTLLNGEIYQSTKAPTDAGEYRVVIRMIETEHYLLAETSANFKIVPKGITIQGGVGVYAKEYDGTTGAALDFTAVEFDGIVEKDQEDLKALFAAVDGAEENYISYTAGYEQKDVMWRKVSASGKEIDDMTVACGDFAIIYEKTTPKLLYNYVIEAEGNITETKGKILQRQITISGVKAKDKVYNGTKEVQLDLSGAIYTGKVSGEALSVNVMGSFEKTAGEPEAEDVILDLNGQPAPKNVSLQYEMLRTADEDTILDNYCLAETGHQEKTTATIRPASLSISNVKAEEKVFDCTTKAEKLDWSQAKIDGVIKGDVVDLSSDNTYPQSGTYEDENVAYDNSGNPIEKTVEIEKYEPQFAAGYWKPNYVLSKITVTGKILPKQLTGIDWLFNQRTQLPTAQLTEDYGVITEDPLGCRVETAIFAKEDTAFENPLPTTSLEDNGSYIAKVVSLSNKNYSLPADEGALIYPFVYDIAEDAKKEGNLKLNNYEADGQVPFTFTYGQTMPEFDLSYDNTDFKKAEQEDYLEYSYKGVMLNGGTYESETAPTQAGRYQVTVKLPETENYLADEVRRYFDITPASITIEDGIFAKDKVYNGTAKAALDLSRIEFSGLTPEDEKTITRQFRKNIQDYIRYTAEFAQKDVAWETGEDSFEQQVGEINVRVSDVSFILTSETPDLFYNYTISQELGQKKITGKITPREVTVSGILAKSKTYDGTDRAELITEGADFNGFISGESLGIDAEGVYEITGAEEKASYVLKDAEGKSQEKKVRIILNGLTAKDGATNAENYIFAEEGQQTETTSTIYPAGITIKEGVTGVDKIYNGTTVAELEFKNVKFDGIAAADEDQVASIFKEAKKDYIAYNAAFDQKDVSWSGEEVQKVRITASGFAFLDEAGLPEVFDNYYIEKDNNQSDISAKILPREITVSGIGAKAKIYDSTEKADVITGTAVFDGKLIGEALEIEAEGVFEKTGAEEKAADVLADGNGSPKEKKVSLTITGLRSAAEGTVAENYCFAKEGQQTETTAVISPAAITKVIWSFDQASQLPSAKITEGCGIVSGSKDTCEPVIVFYDKADTTYTTALAASALTEDQRYAAKVDGVTNPNYALAEDLEDPVYTFIYDKEPEAVIPKEETPKKVTISAAKKRSTARKLNKGAYIKLSGTTLKVKWGKVSDASGYRVYLAKKGGTFTLAAAVDSSKACIYQTTQKQKDTVYRAYVEAFQTVDGKDYTLGRSYEISYAGSEVLNYNATKLTLSKKTLALSVLATEKISASVNMKKKVKETVSVKNPKTKKVTKKKVTKIKTVKKTGSAAHLKYWSTKPSVAGVTAGGTITGYKKGTCYIYVMMRHGGKKKIKVTVG